MNPICITEAQKSHYFKTFDRQRWRFLNAYTNRFKVALDKQIEPVLKQLEKGISEAMSQVDIIQEEPIRKAYEQLYTQVGTYYASNVSGSLKSMTGIETKSDEQFIGMMQAWVSREGAELVEKVSKNTKDHLKMLLNRGIEQNLTVEEIARQIRESGNIAGMTRARVISRTEIIRASNVGSLQGAKSSNIHLNKEWLATIDGRQRPEHEAIMSQNPKGMDEPFLFGFIEAQFPSDPNLDAADSINCRCTLTYIPAEMSREQIEGVQGGGIQEQGFTDGLPDTNNIKEIESLIKEINPNINVKVPSTANPEILKEHYRAIKWFDKNTGGIKTRFDYQYSVKGSSTKGGMLGYFDPNPVNSVGARSGAGDFIPQNIKMISFKDKRAFNEILDVNIKSGHFAKGTTVESIMAHEMAHYIDIIGGLKKAGFVGAKRNGRNVLLRDNRAKLPNTFQREGFEPFIARKRSSEGIMNEMYKSFGINSDLQNDPVLAGQIRSEMAKLRMGQIKEIGRYAGTNPAEYVAMAVQYEYLHPGKNKVAQRITELIFKRYKEAFL